MLLPILLSWMGPAPYLTAKKSGKQDLGKDNSAFDEENEVVTFFLSISQRFQCRIETLTTEIFQLEVNSMNVSQDEFSPVDQSTAVSTVWREDTTPTESTFASPSKKSITHRSTSLHASITSPQFDGLTVID